MDIQKLTKIIEDFSGKRVLVIGDIMLDKYLHGRVLRISPDAPVPVVAIEKESYLPGGASNVANNLKMLGGTVSLIGIYGDDEGRTLLKKSLNDYGISTDDLVCDPKRPTIQKIRVLGQGQHLLRIDVEDKNYLNNVHVEDILKKVERLIENLDIVLISDYAKGIITEELMNGLIDICKKHNKKIIVDPKPKHKNFYKNVTLVTPNLMEARRMAGSDLELEEPVGVISKTLRKNLNSNILVTLGDEGMHYCGLDESEINVPTKAKDVIDVTGAGDTVIATLALAIASDSTFEEAACLANHAAGIVVSKEGTATLTKDELLKSISENGF
jgi:D-glycero-beta-D-manno-heptose-7-phosphate kinase